DVRRLAGLVDQVGLEPNDVPRVGRLLDRHRLDQRVVLAGLGEDRPEGEVQATAVASVARPELGLVGVRRGAWTRQHLARLDEARLGDRRGGEGLGGDERPGDQRGQDEYDAEATLHTGPLFSQVRAGAAGRPGRALSI